MKIDRIVVCTFLVLFNLCVSALSLRRVKHKKDDVSGRVLSNPTTLINAVESQDVQVVLKYLALQDGFKDVDEEKNSMGQTALMIAAKNGNTEIVRVLLSHGANLWLRDHNHKTAITLAQMSNVDEKIKNEVVALLEEAAQPSLYKKMQATPVKNYDKAASKKLNSDEDNDVLQDVLNKIAAED